MNPHAGRLITVGIALLCGIGLGWQLAPMTMDHVAGNSGAGQEGDDEVLYWVAPMDPDYRRDGPGKSPMGMDLVPVYADGKEDSDSFLSIRPEVLNAIGARYAAVQRRDLAVMFTAPATVRPNADRVAHIHVRTEGWVEKLHANAEGNRVQKGALLFEIYSPALVSAQEEYLQAVKADRATLVHAGEERLRALGMLPAQVTALRESGRPQPLYQQRAPQDGILLELNIRQGMYVRPGTTIMSLADISSVWLEAALFPAQLAQVKAGDPVMFSTLGKDLPWRQAVVDYLYPTISDATRTGRIRAVVDNVDRSLRPGQYARMTFGGARRQNALAVPNAAVIRSEGSTRVIRDLGAGRFQPVEVETGLVTPLYTEILQGVAAGDSVVTSAQFLIDSEASLQPALARMTGPDDARPDAHTDHAQHDHGGGA
ncbi:MAG: efflux RND transporter periplasmic adaptor subunit [Chromatocurvus sp.]